MFAVFASNLNHVVIALFPGMSNPVNLGQISLTFRSSYLKELLYSWQASSNIFTSYSTGVEGLQRQLGTRFANTLGGYNTDRVMSGDQFTGSRVKPIGFTANAADTRTTQYAHYAHAVQCGISI